MTIVLLLCLVGIAEYFFGLFYFVTMAHFKQIDYLKHMSERMLRMGHYRFALFYVKWAERSLKGQPFFIYMHGLALYRMHLYELAKNFFESAKGQAPQFDQIDNIIGDNYIQLKAYTQAKPYLDHYLLLHPENIYARINLAIAEYRTNHHEAALRMLDQVLGIDDGNAMALKLKGSVLYKSKQLDQALETFELFNSLGHDDAAVHEHILSIYKQQGRYNDCKVYAENLLASGKEAAAFYVHYGDALCRLGMVQKGAAMLHQGVLLDDHLAEGHYLLAKLLAITHHKNEALIHLKKAIADHPKYVLQARDDDDFNNLRFFRDFYSLVNEGL